MRGEGCRLWCAGSQSLPGGNEAAWHPDALARVLGDQPWSVRRGESYSSLEHETTTLADYLRQCHKGCQNDSIRPFYGANNELPPELAPSMALPPLYPRHAFRLLHTCLWVGTTQSGVHCHRDIQDNFVVVL